MRKRFTPDQDLAMGQLYETGVTVRQIVVSGSFPGATKDSVLHALRRAGVALRKSGRAKVVLTQQERDEILRRYEQGESRWTIKSALGLSSMHPIENVLRESGVSEFDKRLQTGENHYAWKGGKYIDGNGYVRIKLPKSDPRSVMCAKNGYVFEHRLVLAHSLGRPLFAHESVHHINGNRTDNRLENLQLRHGRHGHGARFVCLDCGSHNVKAELIA